MKKNKTFFFYNFQRFSTNSNLKSAPFECLQLLDLYMLQKDTPIHKNIFKMLSYVHEHC